jgi:hypothetical protein
MVQILFNTKCPADMEFHVGMRCKACIYFANIIAENGLASVECTYEYSRLSNEEKMEISLDTNEISE